MITKYIKENIITIGLTIALLIGAILRFKGLIFQNYWHDELFSIYVSNPSKSFIEMYNITIKDIHPPLYQSLLWAWYNLFGFTEFTGRALSALLGTVSIFTTYLLGKEFFNKEVGLYAAIIASMNYFLIYYSQEVRAYSLLFLLSSLSYMYFLRVINYYSKQYFILYLVFTIALLNTHFFGFFLVGTQGIVFVFFFIKEKDKRKLLATLAVTTIMCATISLLPLMQEIVRNLERTEIWIQTPSPWFSLNYMDQYVKNLYLEIIYFLAILISLSYLFIHQRNDTYQISIMILLSWIIIGFLLPYIRSITAIPLLTPRNTTIVIPALILLISFGIFLLKNIPLKSGVMGIIIFLSIYHLNHTNYYNEVTKPQWREVLYEIQKSGTDIPIYDVAWSGRYYQRYTTLLQMDLNIYSAKKFKRHSKLSKLPNCFFVLDARFDFISRFPELKDKAITKALEIKRENARGILYANKIAPQACSRRYTDI